MCTNSFQHCLNAHTGTAGAALTTHLDAGSPSATSYTSFSAIFPAA